MDNSDFWASVAALVKEGFAPEGLAKLERYAEQFISGQLVYKRFSPLEQHGCAAGGTSHVIATLLAGAETQADKDASGASSFQRERQRGAQEAERIERWVFTQCLLPRNMPHRHRIWEDGRRRLQNHCGAALHRRLAGL